MTKLSRRGLFGLVFGGVVAPFIPIPKVKSNSRYVEFGKYEKIYVLGSLTNSFNECFYVANGSLPKPKWSFSSDPDTGRYYKRG